MTADEELAAARERIETLERLVLALAEKLTTVAEHLGCLAERSDARGR
jgi:hypothetical protein